jgi:hypothetical protein
LIPDVSKMEFLEKQVEPLESMRFLSAELELEISESLSELAIGKVSTANAKEAYALLMNQFINRKLEFDFS